MNRPRALFSSFRRLMDSESWAMVARALVFAAASGALTGLALLALLPASAALASGGAGRWLVVLACVGAAAAILEFMQIRTGYRGALGFMRTLHHAVGDKIATLPLGWFKADTAGRLSRLASQELVNLAEATGHFLYSMFSNAASVVVIWIGAWFWDWRLGLLMTFAAPLLALFMNAARRLTARGHALTEPTEEELASRIVEFSRCQGALRSCNAASAGLENAFLTNAKAGRSAMLWSSLGLLMSGTLTQIIVTSMVCLVGLLAVGGEFQPLEAIAAIGMCLRFTTMLDAVSNGLFGLEERRQSLIGIDEVMDAPSQAVPEVSKKQTDPGAVALRDVDFAYESEHPVLRGVSFEVPARSMCAIVGPSGSGKTTIARLISRFYDVDAGSVAVGGADVRELTTEDLMAQLSMVFQDVYLFDDTLEANIRIGSPGADDAELRRAADLAGVTEIVRRLPEGWSSRVGEGGRGLSGGERQRVSVARALLKRAPIVLFDEATSALDAENEAHIVEAMEELRRHSTLLVIAHKLETILAADKVIVLNSRGEVAQEGTHEQLIAVPGTYADFWAQRESAAGWRLVRHTPARQRARSSYPSRP